MVSERLSEIRNYQKKLKDLLNEELIDIILFGSFVREGSANDVDIALIIKNNTSLTEIKAKIKTIFKEEVDFQAIDIYSIYSQMWLTLIKEGFSVKENKFLSEIYHIKPAILYKYSLKKLSAVQKVQFERAIKSVLAKEGLFLTRSVILVPIHMKNNVIELLKKWNIYYESGEYELLPTIRKEELL